MNIQMLKSMQAYRPLDDEKIDTIILEDRYGRSNVSNSELFLVFH